MIVQEVKAYVSRVYAEPYNDSNDIVYMDFDDQPDGCDKNYRIGTVYCLFSPLFLAFTYCFFISCYQVLAILGSQ